MSNLMADFAKVYTDLSRMEYDNADPMRFSKRSARHLAEAILSNAVRDAAHALTLAEAIDSDAAGIKGEPNGS